MGDFGDCLECAICVACIGGCAYCCAESASSNRQARTTTVIQHQPYPAYQQQPGVCPYNQQPYNPNHIHLPRQGMYPPNHGQGLAYPLNPGIAPGTVQYYPPYQSNGGYPHPQVHHYKNNMPMPEPPPPYPNNI